MPIGFVYLIENSFDGTYKIGFTEGTVEDRLKQLLTGSSQELNIVYSYRTEHARKMEKYLHGIFRHKHHRGEWFSLGEENIKSFISICERMEENYKFLNENVENF